MRYSLRHSLSLAIFTAALLGIAITGCAQQPVTVPSSATPVLSVPGQPTASSPILIDRTTGEFRIAGKLNSKALIEPTWHAIVWEKGKNAEVALFQSYASPQLVHDALRFFGGAPGNNLPMLNYGSQYVKGSDVDVFITWSGASRVYRLAEVVKDPEGASGKGIQAKFGGNYDRIEIPGTGCETCFYSCPIGITSNAAYNGDDFARHKKDGQAGFLGNKDVLPAGGTDIVLIYRLKE